MMLLRKQSRSWLVPIAALLLVAALPAFVTKLQADEPDVGRVGLRRISFKYCAATEDRTREGFLWYPSVKLAERHDYKPQIGYASLDAEVAAGPHPLILFSHGFLGAADQTIFLMEAFARQGYVVAAINHADAVKTVDLTKIWRPRFDDAKSWTDQKFQDRRDDMKSLLDELLALNRDKKSFLFGRINPDQVGACGHSLGGYTVLGLAGAWTTWRDERLKAVIALSPYSMPFLTQGDIASVKIPVMIQGGTLDFGITPFQPALYDKLRAPKYLLVLKNETHLGWTNFVSVGQTTIETVQEGNPKFMTDYSLAFFDRHVRGKSQSETKQLDEKHRRLDSYRFESK